MNGGGGVLGDIPVRACCSFSFLLGDLSHLWFWGWVLQNTCFVSKVAGRFGFTVEFNILLGLKEVMTGYYPQSYRGR